MTVTQLYSHVALHFGEASMGPSNGSCPTMQNRKRERIVARRMPVGNAWPARGGPRHEVQRPSLEGFAKSLGTQLHHPFSSPARKPQFQWLPCQILIWRPTVSGLGWVEHHSVVRRTLSGTATFLRKAGTACLPCCATRGHSSSGRDGTSSPLQDELLAPKRLHLLQVAPSRTFVAGRHPAGPLQNDISAVQQLHGPVRDSS